MYANGSLCTSRSSVSSTVTVQRHKFRSISTSSLSSVGSFLSRQHVKEASARSISTFNLTGSASRRGSSIATQTEDSNEPERQEKLRLVEVLEAEDEAHDTTEDEATVDICLATGKPPRDELPPLPSDSPEPEDDASYDEPQAFHRWVSRLRRRKQQQPPAVTPRAQRWMLDDFDPSPAVPHSQRPSHHQKNASHTSSVAFVTAVKSATATIASASIATVSRRNSKLRRAQQHSSILSDHRPSTETQRSLIDAAARQRSRKRREKVQELLQTEEGYLADLKALFNVPDRLQVSHCRC
jgi:hypothetical protein